MDICGPCKFRNEDTKATKYCLTCQEAQCKTCAEIHGSSKATRNHLLLIISDLNNASKTNEDLEKFQNCKDHPEKKLEFFCTDHEHLMCSSCLLNIQKLDCKTIVDIETAGEQLVTNKFNEQLTRDLENIAEHCKKEEREIQSLIDRSHQEKQELQKYIEDIKQKMITHFNKCERDIFKEVDESINTQVTELTSQQTVLREVFQTAEKNKEILQTIINNNSKADLFRCSLSITEQLQQFQSNNCNETTKISTHSVKVSPAFVALITSMDINPILQCGISTNTKTSTSNVSMTTNKNSFLETTKLAAMSSDSDISTDYTCSSADAETEDYVIKPNSKHLNENCKENVDTFVQGDQATTSSAAMTSQSNNALRIQHMSDIAIKIPDGKQLQISGIVRLTDGCLVLSDSRSPRLIRVKEDLSYKDTADLSNPPGSMTVLNGKFLAVCLPTAHRVAFVSVSPEFKWMRNFITKHPPKSLHALDTTRLLVSMISDADKQWHLQILTTDGAIRQNIANTRSVLDASHISSFKLTPTSPRYYLQCCKVSSTLYCFETSGKEVFRYGVLSPKYLHVDTDGKIYVLDSSGLLHILANNGTLLQTMDVPKEASGVTYNKKRDTLYITRQCSDVISVYKISR